MVARWDTYVCEVEDAPASILVDLEAGEDEEQQTLPELVYLSVALASPDASGFPAEEEYESISAVEDAAEAAFDGIGGRYVGRCICAGYMDMFFYMPAGSVWRERAEQALADSSYAWEGGSQEDGEWSLYRDFLFPDDVTLALLENRRACTELGLMGDDTSLSRPVEHWAEFAADTITGPFIAAVTAMGYQTDVDASGEDDSSDMLEVRFSRPAVPDALESDIPELVDVCKAYGGTYLGWSCAVCGDDANEENK